LAQVILWRELASISEHLQGNRGHCELLNLYVNGTYAHVNPTGEGSVPNSGEIEHQPYDPKQYPGKKRVKTVFDEPEIQAWVASNDLAFLEQAADASTLDSLAT
jgi:hypothetical protein